jgi:hypothetical protein
MARPPLQRGGSRRSPPRPLAELFEQIVDEQTQMLTLPDLAASEAGTIVALVVALGRNAGADRVAAAGAERGTTA